MAGMEGLPFGRDTAGREMNESGIDTTFLEVAFYGSLALFAVVERLLPCRRDGYSFGVRWLSNFSLMALELLIAWVLVPGGLIALALYVEAEDWGLLNALPLASGAAGVLLSIVLFDLVKYWEHRLLHRSSLLWRAHVVHHADLDVDFTTTLRHHPFEVMFSLAVGSLSVVVLGLSPLGILVFSMLAAVITIMSHANIRWNSRVDGLLRLMIMTRDAHAVHHSALRSETDSNYSIVFIGWDRLFGTYRAAPQQGLDRFEIGVEYFRSAEDLSLPIVLTMPFRLPQDRRAQPSLAAADDRPGSSN